MSREQEPDPRNRELLALPTIGKEYPPCRYVVGEEKAREFMAAVRMGREDGLQPAPVEQWVRYPQTLIAAYARRAVEQVLRDPANGFLLGRMSLGRVRYHWELPIRAGMRLETRARLAEAYRVREGARTYLAIVILTATRREDGARVSRARYEFYQVGPGAARDE
jgi:hypothetical protein